LGFNRRDRQKDARDQEKRTEQVDQAAFAPALFEFERRRVFIRLGGGVVPKAMDGGHGDFS
jgi:hypothetical protein